MQEVTYNLENYKDVKAEVMMVTPQMAADWLTRNFNNRHLNKQAVRQYAEMIKCGMWEVNNQAIGLTGNDVLKDGQNRLAAVVQANIAVPMLVVSGLDPAVCMMDTGWKRSKANSLEMGGMNPEVANKNVVSAASCLIYLCGHSHPTFPQLKKLIEENEELFAKVVPIARKGSSKPVGGKAVCYAAVFCALYNKISEKKLERCFEVVNTGFANGDYESSAIVLRNTLIGTPMGHGAKAVYEPPFIQCTRAIKDFCDSKPRRIAYSGDPVFFESVKHYIEKEIMGV